MNENLRVLGAAPNKSLWSPNMACRFPPRAHAYLERVFDLLGRAPYPTRGFAAALAAEAGIPLAKVVGWFSRARFQRRKWRAKALDLTAREEISGLRRVLVPRISGAGSLSGEVRCNLGINRPKGCRKRQRKAPDNMQKRSRLSAPPTKVPEAVPEAVPTFEAVPEAAALPTFLPALDGAPGLEAWTAGADTVTIGRRSSRSSLHLCADGSQCFSDWTVEPPLDVPPDDAVDQMSNLLARIGSSLVY